MVHIYIHYYIFYSVTTTTTLSAYDTQYYHSYIIYKFVTPRPS